jgi:hypothetical protein
MDDSTEDVPGFSVGVAQTGCDLVSGSRRFANCRLARLIIPTVCAVLTSCSIPQAVPVCQDLREAISPCTPPLHLVLDIPELVFSLPCETVVTNALADSDYWGSTLSYEDGARKYTLLVLQGVHCCTLGPDRSTYENSRSWSRRLRYSRADKLSIPWMDARGISKDGSYWRWLAPAPQASIRYLGASAKAAKYFDSILDGVCTLPTH